VDPVPSQAGKATVFPQQHIIKPDPEISEAEVPPIRFGTNLAPQQQTIVPTPPEPKKRWYKKYIDVIKNTL
jgi:hypothetical protein